MLKSVEQTLRGTSKSGERNAVLVVGNGLHVQAGREAGLADPDPWPVIAREVAREAGVGDPFVLPPREPALFAALERRARLSRKAAEPESQERSPLRAVLTRELEALEQQRRGLPLYGRIRNLGLDNILSFNIDRTLALGGTIVAPEMPKASKWVTPRDPEEEREHLSRFERHDIVERENGKTMRVWYAYGDTLGDPTDWLGTSGYSSQLRDLESRRAPMMNDWVWGGKLRPIEKFYDAWRKVSYRPDWYRLFFVAPLIFVGASLPLEDWPLWWLLHQRARNHTPFHPDTVPPTFVLAVRGEALPHLAGRPCDIDVVEFPSHDALWKFVVRR